MLRVGVVYYPPWVVVEGARVAGLEPELIERRAGHHGTRVVTVTPSIKHSRSTGGCTM